MNRILVFLITATLLLVRLGLQRKKAACSRGGQEQEHAHGAA